VAMTKLRLLDTMTCVEPQVHSQVNLKGKHGGQS